MRKAGTSGITTRFRMLFRRTGQVSHALLTRSPLSPPKPKLKRIPFDLHVLSTPPAFVLSQNQTLHKKQYAEKPEKSSPKNKLKKKTKPDPKTEPDSALKRDANQAPSGTRKPGRHRTDILLKHKK